MPVHKKTQTIVWILQHLRLMGLLNNALYVYMHMHMCVHSKWTPHIVVYAQETQNSLVSIQIHLYPSIRLPSTLSRQHKAWNDLIYNTISLATDFAFDKH